ncbi:MAG: BON domain-containing protein [Gemmataceae bacterium]
MRRIGLIGMLTGGLLLLASPWALGQGMTSGTSGFGTTGTGGGSSGGFGSSSGGGFAGGFGSSTGGGFSGGFGSSSGGGFAGGFGSSTGGFAGGSGGGGLGGGGFGGTGGLGGSTTQFANSSVFGKYLANPYAAGMAIGRTGTQGSQYARNFPVTLSFGQPVYNTATLGRTQTTGTSALGLGLGATGTNSALRFAGASSAGIRRAPGYLAEPTFPVPERSRAEALRPDLEAVVARSERLPSAGNIRVTTEGETVVLRGRVTSERERRLAEAMIRLTPGVREVRNELQPPRSP